jgi:short-subunit dehydrogenase
MNAKPVAVVTGATKGIGRAIANRFASEGFDLIVCARDKKDLDAMKAGIESHQGVLCKTLVCDLADKRQQDLFVEFVKEASPHVDVLVNNAGIFYPGSVYNERDGALEELMQVNMISCYRLVQGLFANIRKSKKPHIFNIVSTAALSAYRNGGSYSITKYALLGYTRNLREEMKEHGVRVTAVLPGPTQSTSWNATPLPPERFIPAEDIATMIYSAYSLANQTVVEDIVMRPMLGDVKEEEFR